MEEVVEKNGKKLFLLMQEEGREFKEIVADFFKHIYVPSFIFLGVFTNRLGHSLYDR